MLFKEIPKTSKSDLISKTVYKVETSIHIKPEAKSDPLLSETQFDSKPVDRSSNKFWYVAILLLIVAAFGATTYVAVTQNWLRF